MECIKKNEQNSNDCRISSSITYKQTLFLESAFDPPNNEDFYDQSDIDKGYIIKHKDGTYELVLQVFFLNKNCKTSKVFIPLQS